MKNNTTNDAKNKELTETFLNLRLRTGSAHSNKFQEAHTQIDMTSYYIGSIFWFIRVAIKAESLLDLQTDTKAYNDAQFREHIQFLVQIGEGLTEYLPNYAGLLRDRWQETETADQDNCTGNADLDNVALLLSGVLNNPNLPTNVYNGLVRGLDEAFDKLPSDFNKELSDYQNTPEYLSKLLRFSQNAEVEDA